MKEYINEKIVMQSYLEALDADQIQYLQDRPYYKEKVRKLLLDLIDTEKMNDKIHAASALWKALFEAAMTSIDSDKQGYDQLFAYFDEFVEFEELIFASDSFYRDHTLHCLWVYFLEEYIDRQPEFAPLFVDKKDKNHLVNNLLKLFEMMHLESKFSDFFRIEKAIKADETYHDAIKCVSALTHDLGYPLKKIEKINKCMKEMLPYYAIHHHNDFEFKYENIQQQFITSFLTLLSSNLIATIECNYQGDDLNFLECFFTKDEDGNLADVIITDDTSLQMTTEQIELIEKYMTPTLQLITYQSTLLSNCTDFENYKHGIMSAYLLCKNLVSFQNMNYYQGKDFSKAHIDMAKFSAKQVILKAIAKHTNDNFKISTLSDNDSFLTFVDELEEFSRISHASQNREYVEQFCNSCIYMEGDWMHIDFEFSNDELESLNPEISFRGKCKRFLTLFDINELKEQLKLQVNFISRLENNHNTYTLEIANKHAEIRINGEPVNIPDYLHSPEFYTSEQYAAL